MSSIFNYSADDGAYSLTTTGIIVFAVIIALLVILAAFLGRAKSVPADTDSEAAEPKKKKPLFSTRQLVFCAVSLAIAFALSYVKIVHMPWGGSATLCSMLFVAFIGYLYGPSIVQGGGGYILSPMQVGFDYVLAFRALGLSGFFCNKKHGLTIGYIVAIVARGILHTIGGYIYWMDYMPESFPVSLSAVYPLVYNFSYILLEGIITIVIISLPPVKKGLAQIKQTALS